MFSFIIRYLIAWITYYLLLSGYAFVSKNWVNSLNNFFDIQYNFLLITTGSHISVITINY